MLKSGRNLPIIRVRGKNCTFTVLLLLKSAPNRERNMKTVQTFQEFLGRQSFNRQRLYGNELSAADHTKGSAAFLEGL